MFALPTIAKALGYALVYQTVSLAHYKKTAKHYEQYSRELHADLEYICHKMNEAGIEIDDFDKIVLNHVTSKSELEESC